MQVLVSDLVETKTAARMLGVSHTAVWYARRRGTLQTVMVGRWRFYIRQDVEALALERKLAAESKAVKARKGKAQKGRK